MFCVECGKKGPIFRDGLCIECYVKQNEFTHGPEFFDIPFCVHCGGYKYKNTWVNNPFDEVVKRFIKDQFYISKELKDTKIELECIEEKERIGCKVLIKGFIDHTSIEDAHNVFVRLKNTVCDVCSKRFGGYHEAIIQIRAEDRDLTQDELNKIVLFVEENIRNMNNKGQRGIFIADMGPEHGGYTFFISDKSAAFSIVQKLHEKFGGNIKKSSSNIGMEDGRQIYRNTYLVRFSKFTVGDYIEFEKKFFKITNITSNKIKLLNLSNWNEDIYNISKLDDAKIVNDSITEKEMILVSQTKNEIQLMDKKTYSTTQIKKPREIDFNKDNIKVIKIDDRIFLSR